MSTVLAVSYGGNGMPGIFAATTSNEVTAREKQMQHWQEKQLHREWFFWKTRIILFRIKTKKLALFGGGAVRTVRGGTGSGDPFNGGLSGGGDVNVNQSERYNINIYNSFKKQVTISRRQVFLKNMQKDTM